MRLIIFPLLICLICSGCDEKFSGYLINKFTPEIEDTAEPVNIDNNEEKNHIYDIRHWNAKVESTKENLAVYNDIMKYYIDENNIYAIDKKGILYAYDSITLNRLWIVDLLDLFDKEQFDFDDIIEEFTDPDKIKLDKYHQNNSKYKSNDINIAGITKNNDNIYITYNNIILKLDLDGNIISYRITNNLISGAPIVTDDNIVISLHSGMNFIFDHSLNMINKFYANSNNLFYHIPNCSILYKDKIISFDSLSQIKIYDKNFKTKHLINVHDDKIHGLLCEIEPINLFIKPIIIDNILHVYTSLNKMMAIDLDTGKILHQKMFYNIIQSMHACGNTIFMTNNLAQVFAINKDTYKTVWVQDDLPKTRYDYQKLSVIMINDKLHVHSDKSLLYIIDPYTGIIKDILKENYYDEYLFNQNGLYQIRKNIISLQKKLNTYE